MDFDLSFFSVSLKDKFRNSCFDGGVCLWSVMDLDLNVSPALSSDVICSVNLGTNVIWIAFSCLIFICVF